jgi:hypothetical protein
MDPQQIFCPNADCPAGEWLELFHSEGPLAQLFTSYTLARLTHLNLGKAEVIDFLGAHHAG